MQDATLSPSALIKVPNAQARKEKMKLKVKLDLLNKCTDKKTKQMPPVGSVSHR